MSTFLLLPVNEQGTFQDRVIASVLEDTTARPAQFSHLFLFSHGWWTNANAAMIDYDRFIAGFTRCMLADPFAKPLADPVIGNYFATGVHWPSVLTEDDVSVLNYAQALSFFSMRSRADAVGENAGYATLNVATRSGAVTRLNLIGHSFGCRVICSTVQKLLTNDPTCLDNLDVRIVLLEPAFDQEDLEWGGVAGPPQRYGLVLQNPRVRMLITRSGLDVALSVGYPLANVIGDVVNHADGAAVEAVVRALLSRLSGPLEAVGAAAGTVVGDLVAAWNRLHHSEVNAGALGAPVEAILGRREPKALTAARLVLAGLEAAHVDVALAAGGAGLRAPFITRLGGRYLSLPIGPGWAGAAVAAGPQSVVVADLSALHNRPDGANPPWNDHHSDIYLPEIYRLLAWFLF
ncbi:MAG TPA: hypothetical protein VEP50_20900 [bacterium]|nr:hypothetical protein [bacterium]